MHGWDTLMSATEAVTSSRGHSIMPKVFIWSYLWYLFWFMQGFWKCVEPDSCINRLNCVKTFYIVYSRYPIWAGFVSALIHFRLIAVGKLDKIDDFSPDVAVREWNQIKLHINKPRNRRAMGPSTSSRNKLQFTVYWKKAVGSKVHTKVSIIYIQS